MADLTAFHEQTEIGHKLAGRSHAYPHRRVLLEELLAAKQVFEPTGGLRGFIRNRTGMYPDQKVRDKEGVEGRFYDFLTADTSRKGQLLKVITDTRL